MKHNEAVLGKKFRQATDGVIHLPGGEVVPPSALSPAEREIMFQACDGVQVNGHAINNIVQRVVSNHSNQRKAASVRKNSSFKTGKKRTKQLREAISSGTPVWRAALSKADWEDFGNFVKRRISNSIPAGVEGAAVVPYLDTNPKATQIGKVGPGGGGGMPLVDLVDFYNGSRELQSRLNSMDGAEDPDRKRARELAKKALEMGLDHDDSVEQEDEPAGQKYRRGEETLSDMGDVLGITAAGAKKVGDRGEEYVSKLFKKAGISAPSRARQEQEETLFGKTGLINRAVAQAATDYANVILDAIPVGETWEDGVSEKAVTRVFRALAANHAAPAGSSEGRNEDDITREVEKVATLIALGIDGDVDDIADEVTADWESENNILSSFQNLVAKTFRNMFDAEEIAAGEKKRKGRPAGTTQAAMAARQAAAPPAPPPGKRGRKPNPR